MTMFQCPGCGKPVTSRAQTCRWCGFVLQKPAGSETAPAFDAAAELEDLARWGGTKRPLPPLFSMPKTLLLGGMGSLLFGLAAFFIVDMGFDMGLRLTIFCAVLLGSLAAVLAWEPFKLRSARQCRSAEAVAACYFGLIKQGRFDAARAVLAGHPSAKERHESLSHHWSVMNPGGIATVATIDLVVVGTAESITEELAVVPVRVVFGRETSIGAPFVGGVRWSSHHKLDVLKLAVRRNKRWFLVNGLPPDVLDRKLIEQMGKR